MFAIYLPTWWVVFDADAKLSDTQTLKGEMGQTCFTMHKNA